MQVSNPATSLKEGRMNYREEFPDHLIIEKYLWVGNVSVEINHIDNDLNRPLDYEEAFKKMKSKLTEESSND